MYDDQNVGPSDTGRLSIWDPIKPGPRETGWIEQ